MDFSSLGLMVQPNRYRRDMHEVIVEQYDVLWLHSLKARTRRNARLVPFCTAW
jgi:hypothetical protein